MGHSPCLGSVRQQISLVKFRINHNSSITRLWFSTTDQPNLHSSNRHEEEAAK